MQAMRLVLFVVLAGMVLLLGLTLFRALSGLDPASAGRPQPVPHGDQEIAWIHAATSGATWERFVAGVHHLRHTRSDVEVQAERAFPEQTAAVPEIVLRVPGRPGALRIRWYKLTSDMGIEQWVAALAQRQPAPLGIIGGGSSDRARDLALALRREDWQPAAPLLLLTTATADKVHIPLGSAAADLPPASPLPTRLMELYPGRTFRFCFQNSQMAEAVVDFVWSQPDLRPHASPARLVAAASAAFAAGPEAWSLLNLVASIPLVVPAPVFAVGWDDDPYSSDLAERFQSVLHSPGFGLNTVTQYNIPYSVGDYYEPNRREAEMVAMLTQELSRSPQPRRLLVLPTGVQPARRVLRKLTLATPEAVRNVVAVTGDSINFNNIYRDRQVAWNVQETPVTLVFFCHQDPVRWPQTDGDSDRLPRRYASATDDVLLNAELMELVVKAVWNSGTGEITADLLAERLRESTPAFFAPDGNRLGRQGEFVVCLRPQLRGEEVLAGAIVEVWRRGDSGGALSPAAAGSVDGASPPPPGASTWQLHRRFEIRYDGGDREGGPGDASS